MGNCPLLPIYSLMPHMLRLVVIASLPIALFLSPSALKLKRSDGQDKLADWLENNIEECLAVIDCPPEVQKHLRIVAAKAMDLSDEWEGITSKATISPEKLRQTAEMLKAASSQPKKSAS